MYDTRLLLYLFSVTHDLLSRKRFGRGKKKKFDLYKISIVPGS